MRWFDHTPKVQFEQRLMWVRELAKQIFGEKAFQEQGKAGANISRWEFAWYVSGIARSQCG